MVYMPIIFLMDFFPKKVTLEFLGAFFLAKIFKKVRFDPYNFQITKLSARKSEQIKIFRDKNMPTSTI